MENLLFLGVPILKHIRVIVLLLLFFFQLYWVGLKLLLEYLIVVIVCLDAGLGN